MPDLEAVPALHPATSLRCLLLLAITVECDVQAATDSATLPIYPNGGLTDNRTVCAANLDAFTVCGSCPTGFFSPGGMSLTEYACTLPDATPSRPLFGNASRCAVQTVSP